MLPCSNFLALALLASTFTETHDEESACGSMLTFTMKLFDVCGTVGRVPPKGTLFDVPDAGLGFRVQGPEASAR